MLTCFHLMNFLGEEKVADEKTETLQFDKNVCFYSRVLLRRQLMKRQLS